MKLHTQNTHVDVDFSTTIYFCTIHSSISIHLHIFYISISWHSPKTKSPSRRCNIGLSYTYTLVVVKFLFLHHLSPHHLFLHHLCLFFHRSLLFVITGWFFVFLLLLGVLFFCVWSTESIRRRGAM